ncbi:hypothetical protein HAALTHF_48550n [Vreelandella aquamarina]|nr:hypothetical protein HAALTHF_48550n [Halomonas axialensis]
MITTTGSLDALNNALVAGGNTPVPMNRFRPNIVVDCDEAWQEDGWATIESGSYQLTLRKPCQRCKITTVDQQTGTIPTQAEPLKTLLALNTQPHLKGAHFGQNATLTAGKVASFVWGSGLRNAPLGLKRSIFVAMAVPSRVITMPAMTCRLSVSSSST